MPVMVKMEDNLKPRKPGVCCLLSAQFEAAVFPDHEAGPLHGRRPFRDSHSFISLLFAHPELLPRPGYRSDKWGQLAGRTAYQM